MFTTYEEILNHVLNNGWDKPDRTGTGTKSVVGVSAKFNLRDGFPLVTTKDMSGIRFKGIVAELLWFLAGDTNNNTLKDQRVNIWNAWAKEDGQLGPIYGHQWRNFNSQNIDQVNNIISQIKDNPSSRRLLVSAWNPAQNDQMALPPCHFAWQVVQSDFDELSMVLYMRSNDVFLGLPYNIASYSLLLELICKTTGFKPGDLFYTAADCHLYQNHIDQAKLQLERVPYSKPKLVIANKPDIFSYTVDDIKLEGYTSHPSIQAPIAV